MNARLESARRQFARFDRAAVRDGVENEPAVARFRAVLAVRLLNLTRSGGSNVRSNQA